MSNEECYFCREIYGISVPATHKVKRIISKKIRYLCDVHYGIHGPIGSGQNE